MDIEHLNKSQIVLLTLLTSFVTSIATGIVTVSLMEQAPPVIPQTINRVVERTVERVVPHETQTATVITTEKTVVVKETDLISQAVARVRPSALYVHTAAADASAGDFIARGFVVADGYAISGIVGAVEGGKYVVQMGEKAIPARVVKVDEVHNLALLSLDETDTHAPAAVLSTSDITLGQTVISITGASSIKVASGIVTAVNDVKTESGDMVQASFETNIGALVLGSPIVNTDGGIIGMYVGDDIVAPTSALATLVRSAKPTEQATSTKAQ
ncbi:MAG: trypsin-like peptidase domain-containing protein [Parcubacteria group bacterium]|nr:trypsin-like peptidase domain-containing protein [Parcubacteria group bacterium]